MNIYIQQIRSICLPNKYTNWYCNIITKRLQDFSSRIEAKEALGYCEGHHILPRAFKMGGEKDKTNIVFLSAREHFLVHLLLVKMIDGPLKYKMTSALNRFKRNDTVRSRTYELVKIITSEYSSNKLESTQEKKRATNLIKYGVTNVLCTDQSKTNAVSGCLKKYGVKYSLESPEIQNKIKSTNLEKFGCEAPFMSEDIQNKVKSTNMERYGVDYLLKSPEIWTKTRETIFKKYGVKHQMQSEEIKSKYKSTNMERYGFEHPMQTDEAKKLISDANKGRIIIYDPINNYNSRRVKESDLDQYLSSGWCLSTKFSICIFCDKQNVSSWHITRCSNNPKNINNN